MRLGRKHEEELSPAETAHIERVADELDRAFAVGGEMFKGGRRQHRGAYKKIPTIIRPDETIVAAAKAQFTESVWSKNDKWLRAAT